MRAALKHGGKMSCASHGARYRPVLLARSFVMLCKVS